MSEWRIRTLLDRLTASLNNLLTNTEIIQVERQFLITELNIFWAHIHNIINSMILVTLPYKFTMSSGMAKIKDVVCNW